MDIILTPAEKEHSKRVKEVLDLLKFSEEPGHPERRVAVVNTQDCIGFQEEGYYAWVVRMEES